MSSSVQSKQKQRRTRRLRRRGRMAGLPTGRKRSKWPRVPMARRYHRFRWTRKPRYKWTESEDMDHG